ncbi:unnamed protein product (macronuclear) [Paramecium tetraurelia]|uniref:Uncharacterized protein n=1 Tax=Paramecium tetraurelia TaxID=5888 RepID=A0DFB5_PARTE|nr:uncharacterized protein GSPATT00016545001 [Paramecium tetraurelia]CAK81732.1 unnamed protein product [Paramecium tetraurelia]|eukprot:XP_001449129.1 hypothetical protein (macronuclear) [Paramecium tetraurelia strain d4-2]
MQELIERTKLQIALNQIQTTDYQKLVQDTELLHQNIIVTLNSIQNKEIQDFFFILKPTQQLYNCICGLLCTVAGLDKAISTDYLFLQTREWVPSQSQFCKNYEPICQILTNIQQYTLKKKINVTNIKEAMKYYTQNVKTDDPLTVTEKLEYILKCVIDYYDSFHKILKFNKNHELQKRTPQKNSQDQLKTYMLAKLSSNFNQDESEEILDEHTQIQLEDKQQIQSTTNQTPLKMLNRFKDFNSYSKNISCNPKISISPSSPRYHTLKKYSSLCKSPVQSNQQSFNLTNEGQNFQENGSAKSLQPMNQSNNSKSFQQEKELTNSQSITKQVSSPPPVISPRQLTKKEVHVTSYEAPNLDQIAEKINNDDPDIEQQLKNEIQNVLKQLKKIEGVKKHLLWEDDRQSKQHLLKADSSVSQQQAQQVKLNIDNSQQIPNQKQVQNKKKSEKISTLKTEPNDFKTKRIQSLYKELERTIEQKNQAYKDAQWIEQQVYTKNLGIQKY